MKYAALILALTLSTPSYAAPTPTLSEYIKGIGESMRSACGYEDDSVKVTISVHVHFHKGVALVTFDAHPTLTFDVYVNCGNLESP